MNCKFEDTLHYCSPANGGRGVVRTGMLAPESVELFVCPFACGRHGAISAIKQDLKHRLFYLYVDQCDIVNGYDDLIAPAVDELLATISPRPKVMLIFVSCLDDLLGTDHEAILEDLHAAHPDIQFRFCHMNPISSGSATPPPVSIQNNLYSLLELAQIRDTGVNCIGNIVPVSPDSELYPFLQHLGCDSVRHISQYETFADYQQMSRSGWNLVVAPAGRQAAQQMEPRLNLPHLFLPVSYRLEEIARNYTTLSGFIHPDKTHSFDFTQFENQARKAIDAALVKVGSTPIVVDGSAVSRPFGLARALLEYGFNVVRVQAQECVSIDRVDGEWVTKLHPQVEVVQPQHHKAVQFENRLPESIAIGVDGAYLAGSRYVVDLFGDEGMYGYHGVVLLMSKLACALDRSIDLETMIHEFGLVV